MENPERLINELRMLPKETPWVEFKVDSLTLPQDIGEYISALGNSAALYDKAYAYLIWGIQDQTHEIVGTHFNFHKVKVGNEDLYPWLFQRLSKNVTFEFTDVVIQGKNLVILRIDRALYHTIRFTNNEYIRVDSQKRNLKDCPQFEIRLWDKLRSFNYETLPAKEHVSPEAVIELLDCQKYFELKNISFPSTTLNILHYFIEDKIISRQDDGLYSITNLGALLLARQLSEFPSVSRKAVRVVLYLGQDRSSSIRNHTIQKGYASGFEGLIELISAIIPSQEVIQGALRKELTPYPEIMFRESIANALIHQDLSISGAGPLVEIFSNRIEITNPGTPLIDTMRFIDNPPRSRNEMLASLMRQFHICEELGTGWDKIALACEEANLPAPAIQVYADSTKIILYSYISYVNLSFEERIAACYMHACIKWINHEFMTNSSLRERFIMNSSSSATISNLIKQTLNRGLIKPLETNTAPKHMKYYPFWG